MKFEGPDRDEIGVSGPARDLSQPGMALRNRTFFRSKREQWQAEYVKHLWFTDFLVVCGAVATAQFVRFGDFASQSTLVASHSNRVGYWAVSVVIAVLWIAFLAVFHTRSPRIIGTGPEEYRRIASATFRLFGAVAILSLLLQTDIARGYLAIAFPLGLGALLVNHWLWRLYAVRRRQQGEYQTAVLVVGNNGAVADMSAAFMAAPGYRVVGVCTPTGPSDPSRSVKVRGEQIKVVGADDGIVDAVRLTEADTVALAATDHLSPEQIRELAWDLEELGVDLMIRPGLVDVAGPRLQTRPVDSMPMLHIEPPQYDRAKSVHKRAFDIAFSTLAMLAVLPVLIGTAIAVKVTSRGPILYRSERMGLNGEPFRMIKFRSMSTDADRHLPALMAQNEGSGLLFKMRDDPRVTKVGKFIRRFSIDELPQFVNVLRGEMSVVGPRPPLRTEMEQYDGQVRRRMLVKPGLTGLWQISGRSDLSWEESVRLDLSYVENWSMTQDLLIIRKTISAVTRSDGAY
ncbi:MAG TPA: sugar transferase [Aldersonia sp.]